MPTGACVRAHARFNAAATISCASARLCAATDGGGDVVASTRPATGAASWTVAKVDPHSQFGLPATMNAMRSVQPTLRVNF